MKKILINLDSESLGDTIGVMPCIEKFISNTTDNVYLKSNSRFNSFFTKSYPTVKFFEEGINYDKTIDLEYNFNLPLQTGFAHQLGFMDWEYIQPKIDIIEKPRPIKGKYVTISIHSTSQLKYWNHPLGIKSQPLSPYWDELCGLLRKHNLTPIIVERDEMFGKPPYRNGMPNKANKKFGLSIEETMNYIQHSEFFIGLSSGLSWLAHAMDKKVAMISNFSEDWHEFDLSCENYKRITNKSVCHGCWNMVNKEHSFDISDWYWCPKHKDTERQFECHTSITPQMVFEEIKNWII
jgi:autotransporter strand-loop-strand O-heptosyltransferase